MREGSGSLRGSLAVERPIAAAVISALGGLLILLYGVVLIAAASIILRFLPVPLQGQASDIGSLLRIWGVIGVILGGLILLLGLLMLAKPARAKPLGIAVLVLSLASITGGAGLLVGLVLGLVGGILGIVFKPTPRAPFPAAPPQ